MITYIFGAGASAQAVPIVKDIPSDIEKLIEKLYDPTNFPNEAFYSDRKKKWVHDLLDHFPFNEDQNFPERQLITHNLRRLKEIIGASYSIDTVGRRFFLVDRKHYDEYKRLLVLWMTLTQFFNKPDPRYELFLATVLDSPEEGLPKNKLNLISWNYDLQMEIAYSKFLNNGNNIGEAADILKIATKYHGLDGERKQSGLAKINGTCSHRWHRANKEIGYYANVFEGTSTKQFLNQVFENYKSNKPVELSFAWEDQELVQREFSKSINTIEYSQAIVIIGYSFPTFNRKIDKLLFDGEKINGRRIPIYIQDMEPQEIANKLKMNFKINPELIVPLSPRNISEFFIPPEYD